MDNVAKVMNVINNSYGATSVGISSSTGLELDHVRAVLQYLHDGGAIRAERRVTMGGNKFTYHPVASYEEIDAAEEAKAEAVIGWC